MIELEAETRLALVAAGFSEAQIDAEVAACGGNFDKAADKLLASSPTPPTTISTKVLFPPGSNMKSQNGAPVQIGYGVGTAWFKSAGSERDAALRAGVVAALDAGFRHIDEAEMYENEDSTGAAIASWLATNSDKATRADLFITSKALSVVDMEGGVEEICKRSLKAMQTSYFDLYLLHAPFQRSGDAFRCSLVDVWKQMEALVESGLVKAIGVSNWRVQDLKQIVGTAKIQPVCNQVEAHPYLQQTALLDWCTAHAITISSYAPLAPLTKIKGGPVDAVVAAAAAAHGKTEGQILLRWQVQTGRLPLTTTSKPERLVEYLNVNQEGFELSADEVAAISAAGSGAQQRLYWLQCKGAFSEDPTKEPQ